MRTLMTTSLLLALAACTGLEHNRAGPAYDEAGRISILKVLPAELPSQFLGNFDPQDEQAWRRDWPRLTAEVLAGGVNHATGGSVRASVTELAPTTGYYMTTRITYLDVGSGEAQGVDDEGWSHVLATCRIFNAASNELVAELGFQERAGWLKEVHYQDVIARMGESLGRWFRAREQG